MEVARTRSFTRAADTLNMSQPALSAQLRELERQLGFTLFERSSRRVELSREGMLFLGNAQRLILETEWATQAALEIRGRPLRIGVAHHSQLIAQRTALTDGFLAAHPDARVKVHARDPRQLLDELGRDAIDVAIMLEVVGAGTGSLVERAPAGTQRLAIGRLPLGVAVPRDHRWACDATIDPAQLAGERIITFSRTHGVAVVESVIGSFGAHGAIMIHAPEGDVLSAMRHAASRGLACVDIGWFDPGLAGPGAERLVARPVDWPVATELVVRWNSSSRNDAVRRFADHAEAFARPVWP